MKGKDLINIGIFSAIYFVIVFIVAMLGMIPIFLPLLAVITSGIFSLWIAGSYLPLFFAAEEYWASRQDYGQEYIDTVNSLMPVWMCPVMFAVAFVCGIIGGLLGKALMKKHFEKAGIV